MKEYAIHWKCLITGTIGTGTKRFEKDEAQRLAKELNESHPKIVHEAVIPSHPAPPAAEPPAIEPGEGNGRLGQLATVEDKLMGPG